MTTPITYAKVNGPPANWMNLDIYDGDRLLDGVIEVDTTAGYALQYFKDDDGHWVHACVNGEEKMIPRRVESKNLTIRVRE